jgi:hypothetical protein
MSVNLRNALQALDDVQPIRDLWADALARVGSSERFRPPHRPLTTVIWNAKLALVAVVVAAAAVALVPVGGASIGARAVAGIESLWTTQNVLDGAADDARSIAGSYFTGDAVHPDANTVDIYLKAAPQSVIDQLNAQHPGIYVIHNDAPNTSATLRKLTATFDPKPLEAHGIQVDEWGPTPDGYFQVGVTADVATAQAILDKIYGPNVVRADKAQPGERWARRSSPRTTK